MSRPGSFDKNNERAGDVLGAQVSDLLVCAARIVEDPSAVKYFGEFNAEQVLPSCPINTAVSLNLSGVDPQNNELVSMV